MDAAHGVPSYDDLRKAADEGELTKFFDVNLTQLLTDTPLRDTIEIRILPGAITAGDIVNRAALVELLLDRCRWPEPFPPAPADPVVALDALLQIAAEVLAARDDV